MAFLFRLFQRRAVAPGRVPTDTIIPLAQTDSQPTLCSMVLEDYMRFDDVLDAGKLVGALERLIEKPGWRKLGGRLRRNAKNKLEYHIPTDFTAERRAVDFSHTKHDIPISKHPVASQLQRPSNTIQVGHDLNFFRPVFSGRNPPTELADYLNTDRPQLNLHVTSFTDATIIKLAWSHSLFDAMARYELFRAWQAMLEDREEDVPEVHGYGIDPLVDLGEDAKERETSVLQDKALKGLALMKFVIVFLWETVMHREEEFRLICVPGDYLKRIKQEALDELATAPTDLVVRDQSDSDKPKPFLSDGDILCAWWARLTTSCQPWAASNPNTTICIYNPLDLRDILSTTEPKLMIKGKAYLSSCTALILSFIRVRELLGLPLGHIAARIRKDLVIQSTRAQINASFKLWRTSMEKTGRPPLYGDADMSLAPFSNWNKGKMFETDFSAAVIREGDAAHVKGRPSLIWVYVHAKGFSVRNSGPCVGRDWLGNYWIASALHKETWDNIRNVTLNLS